MLDHFNLPVLSYAIFWGGAGGIENMIMNIIHLSEWIVLFKLSFHASLFNHTGTIFIILQPLALFRICLVLLSE